MKPPPTTPHREPGNATEAAIAAAQRAAVEKLRELTGAEPVHVLVTIRTDAEDSAGHDGATGTWTREELPILDGIQYQMAVLVNALQASVESVGGTLDLGVVVRGGQRHTMN